MQPLAKGGGHQPRQRGKKGGKALFMPCRLKPGEQKKKTARWIKKASQKRKPNPTGGTKEEARMKNDAGRDR